MHLVWPVVEAFLYTVGELLDGGRPIYLRGVGTFKWRRSRKSQGFMLRFTPAENMRRGRDMEKYGVVLDDEKTKQAEEGKGKGVCPRCGKKLEDTGACPEHGTEPLERRPDE